jgi:hypothetical protein
MISPLYTAIPLWLMIVFSIIFGWFVFAAIEADKEK